MWAKARGRVWRVGGEGQRWAGSRDLDPTAVFLSFASPPSLHNKETSATFLAGAHSAVHLLPHSHPFIPHQAPLRHNKEPVGAKGRVSCCYPEPGHRMSGSEHKCLGMCLKLSHVHFYIDVKPQSQQLNVTEDPLLIEKARVKPSLTELLQNRNKSRVMAFLALKSFPSY